VYAHVYAAGARGAPRRRRRVRADCAAHIRNRARGFRVVPGIAPNRRAAAWRRDRAEPVEKPGVQPLTTSSRDRNGICDLTQTRSIGVRVMRRAISDAMMTAGGALVVVLALVAFDDQVREQVTMRLSSRPSNLAADAGSRLHDVATVLMVSAHQQSIAHAPLMFFTLAGIVLVLFMLRT
jgi:hypothetical protein